MSDHAETAKRLLPKDLAAGDPNLHVNWGMSARIGGESSFAPIGDERRVRYFTCGSSKRLQPNDVAEMQHDANKVYAALAGLPKRRWVPIDLEDTGIYFSEHPATEKHVSSAASILGSAMGGSWISDAPVDASTRMGLAWRQSGDSWRVHVCTVADVFGHLESYVAMPAPPLLKYFCEVADAPLETGDVFLPIVSPLRMVSSSGVVFIG